MIFQSTSHQSAASPIHHHSEADQPHSYPPPTSLAGLPYSGYTPYAYAHHNMMLTDLHPAAGGGSHHASAVYPHHHHPGVPQPSVGQGHHPMTSGVDPTAAYHHSSSSSTSMQNGIGSGSSCITAATVRTFLLLCFLVA